MWTRRRFLERIGGGVGVAATLGVGGMECVLAAGQAVRGRSPQELAADEDCWREIQEADIRPDQPRPGRVVRHRFDQHCRRGGQSTAAASLTALGRSA